MSNLSDDLRDDAELDEPRPSWELPEVVAIAILVMVGLVVLGGLATGIAAAVGTSNLYGPPDNRLIGAFIEAGAGWAGPLFVFVVLVVLGLCWLQIQGWSQVAEDSQDGTREEADFRIRRALQVALCARIGLVLTAAGAIALFVGVLIVSTQGATAALNWSRAILAGASAVGAVVLAVAGFWASRQMSKVME